MKAGAFVGLLQLSEAKPETPPEFWKEFDSQTYAGEPWKSQYRRAPGCVVTRHVPVEAEARGDLQVAARDVGGVAPELRQDHVRFWGGLS